MSPKQGCHLSCLTLEGMNWALWAETTEGGNASGILVSVLEEGNTLIYPHRATAPSSVHRACPGEDSHTANAAASG